MILGTHDAVHDTVPDVYRSFYAAELHNALDCPRSYKMLRLLPDVYLTKLPASRLTI